MKIKIVTSVVFALLLCSFMAYNSVSLKADSNYSEKTPPFGGNLYSRAGCGNELLNGVPYVAQNRTTGSTYNSVTVNGAWGVPGVKVGELVMVTFTLNGKIGCILQQQVSSGWRDLKVCMTNSNYCPNEW